jgi:3-methyladenine DNA glycosylase/8-oxoguanine DNA glycosylase
VIFAAANGPFDAAAALGYLQRHAIPGVELVDVAAGRLRRLLTAVDGPVAIDLVVRSSGVEVSLTGTTDEPPPELIGLVRRWFDLDADLVAVGRVLDQDPALAAVGRALPGLRVTGYPDGFEGVIATVLGQQVSLAAARTFAGRLVAAYGRPHPSGLLQFPGPERLAGVPVEEVRATVGLTRARARTLQAVARLFAGGFRLEPAHPNANVWRGASTEPVLSLACPELVEGSMGSGHVAADAGHVDAARAALLAVAGIGAWTVDYLAMRALHESDACPAGDLVLRRALGADRVDDVLARAERWRPFRAYGVVRLWAAAAAGLPVAYEP